MALAICLLLDPRSERAIRGLWERLERLGASTLLSHTHGNHVPHLSYAVLRSFDVDAVRGAMEEIETSAPVGLHVDAVGHFHRGRVALIPAVGAGVLHRQERVVDAVTATGADLHRYYRPGRWVPHLSIATRAPAEHLAAIVSAAHDILPLEAVGDRAALIDSATGERWALQTLP